MQSLPFRWSNLSLLGSEKFCYPASDDSLRPCHTTDICRHPACLSCPDVICWVASNPAQEPTLNLYQPGEHHSPLQGDSLRTYLLSIIRSSFNNWAQQVEDAGGGEPHGALGLLLNTSLTGAGRSWLWCTAWPFSCTWRHSRAATNCGLLYRLRWVAQGQSQAVSDIDLNQSLSQEAPEPTNTVANFSQNQSAI